MPEIHFVITLNRQKEIPFPKGHKPMKQQAGIKEQ